MTETNKNKEIWKDVPEYEGYYQVSYMGRVRRLDRTVTYSDGRNRFYKGALMRGSLVNGYRRTTLKVSGRGRYYTFAQLVAIAFLGHKPKGHELVVDHIDGDKSNDAVKNLRVVTNRENCTTCFRANNGSFSSEYAGVSWHKGAFKWLAQTKFNGKTIRLGLFTDEEEASIAYQLALSKIDDGSFNPDDYKPKFTSRHKGVFLHKSSGKWQAQITINGKQEHIGLFPTELEAYQARLKAEQEINDGIFLPRKQD